MPKSTKWFDLGADALQRLFPTLPRCYVCPLCLRVVKPGDLAGDSEILSEEHVPSEASGGRPLCLTCKPCNNWSGHTLDNEQLNRRSQLRFVRGTMDKPEAAELTWSDKRIQVDVLYQGDTIVVRGLPQVNNPAILNEWASSLGQHVLEGVQEDLKFSLRLKRGYRVTPAQVAMLRSAYLVAFAYYGYSYVLDPALDIVREQIANPSRRLIEWFSITSHSSSPAERRLVLIQEPEYLRSMSVQMGESVVFLPFPGEGPGLYDRIAMKKTTEIVQLNYSGWELDWPRQPLHKRDFL